jgi:hypothetical protein
MLKHSARRPVSTRNNRNHDMDAKRSLVCCPSPIGRIARSGG